MKPTPRTLPVGVSLTVQYNNRYQRERDLPEDRHYAYSGHVTWCGCSYARNFRIDQHGEELAFLMACKWREVMVRSLTKGAPFIHRKLGLAGRRREIA